MRPNLIMIAGPNGAGKTTAAADILVGALAVQEFVNADLLNPANSFNQWAGVNSPKLRSVCSPRQGFGYPIWR
jgi:predicted ABC-type ATPase